MVMEGTVVETPDGLFQCPFDDCVSKYSLLKSLRMHCYRSHDGARVSVVPHARPPVRKRPVRSRAQRQQHRHQQREQQQLQRQKDKQQKEKQQKQQQQEQKKTPPAQKQLKQQQPPKQPKPQPEPEPQKQRQQPQQENSQQAQQQTQQQQQQQQQHEEVADETMRQPFGAIDAIQRGAHQAKDAIVECRESLLPNAGYGVFALQDFEKDDLVTTVDGTTSDQPGDDHSFSFLIGVNEFLNAIQEPQPGLGIGSFVQKEERVFGSRKTRKNCQFFYDQSAQRLFIEVTKKIKKGDELFTTYGRGYRKKAKPSH